MDFSPFNKVVKLCLKGIDMEERGNPDEAMKLFQQGYDQATNNFERFLASHYIAQQQKTVSDKLNWLETTLQFAIKVNDNAIKSAFPSLYTNIAKCFEELNNPDKAKEYMDLADSYRDNPSDKGPFYHGTKADLMVGDMLTAGGNSNYKSEIKMNHIYFTALVNVAGLAALATGDSSGRVYIVEPTGKYEHDPNLTDMKFPGNPTRSYRSESPLKIVGEVMDWGRPATEELQKFRNKLENNKGEIIN